MGHVEFHPHLVRAWGHAAHHCGHDVRTTKHPVSTAENDAGYAQATGLASRVAANRYTDAVETGIGSVADALIGTGDKLLSTANVVVTGDDASVDLFRYTTGRLHIGIQP